MSSASITGALNFDERHFQSIAETVRLISGIDLPERKKSLVYGRLVKRIRVLGLESFDEYCALIRDKTGKETEHLLSSLTTNVTRFFREPHHFEYLEREQYPRLFDLRNKSKRIRFWSAGCSTGEEAYSLAMSLYASCGPQKVEHIRILATDIDHQVLRKAESGIYPKTVFPDIPSRLKPERFLKQIAETVEVAGDIRSMIRFRHLNLVSDWPINGPFDAIFCRNVAIYFDQATQQQLWSKFERVLAPGGILAIGHSERLSGPALNSFENVGITTYRKRNQDSVAVYANPEK